MCDLLAGTPIIKMIKKSKTNAEPQRSCSTSKPCSTTGTFWCWLPCSQGHAQPHCFPQCPERHFKGRTGTSWRWTRASACSVGTWETEANDKGEENWKGRERQNWKGRDICGNNLLREAGTGCIQGTADWARLRGKKRSWEKGDTAPRWRRGLGN